MVVDAGTQVCGRCGGRIITDSREGERFCLTCGDRPVTATDLALAHSIRAAEEAVRDGKRWRAPSIRGMQL